MRYRNDGFTLVEVGVVVPIIMILGLILFSVMFNYLLASNRDQVQLYQAYSQSSALDRLENDVRLSTAFLQTEDPSINDPYGPDNTGAAWNYSGTDTAHRALVLRELATANNPLSTNRTPVYTMTTSAPNCNSPSSISGPLSYDIVYFITGTTLYKRILPNTAARTCQTQYQLLSCPPAALLGNGTRNTACKADDEVIALNVSGFSVDYYSSQSSPSKLDAYTTPSLVSSSRTVGVTIENSQKSYNGSVTTNSSVRLSSQNTLVGGN